jgi:hypothetical protein
MNNASRLTPPGDIILLRIIAVVLDISQNRVDLLLNNLTQT